MISASALLVVIAFVTLVIGIFQSGLGLIWVSIAASVLAAVFLGLGVVGGRRPLAADGMGEAEEAPAPGAFERAGSLTLAPQMERAETAEVPAVMEEEEEEQAVPVRRAPAKPRAGKPAAIAARARAAAATEEVVVIPDRDKYHKATCRYAKGAGAMTLGKNAARRQGYKRCGVCKP